MVERLRLKIKAEVTNNGMGKEKINLIICVIEERNDEIARLQEKK